MEVLQAEVTALKQLVLTSTSSPGNSGRLGWRRHSTEHLAPCPDCDSYDCDAAVARFNGTRLQGPHHSKNSLAEESEVCLVRLYTVQFMFRTVDSLKLCHSK